MVTGSNHGLLRSQRSNSYEENKAEAAQRFEQWAYVAKEKAGIGQGILLLNRTNQNTTAPNSVIQLQIQLKLF